VADDTELNQRRAASAHVFTTAWQLELDGPMAIDESTERHLGRVLRLRDGEVVTVTDGAGRWRATRVRRTVDRIELEPDGRVIREEPRHGELTIATALPKGDRLDQLVQKTTELGVDHLVLLHCDRSVVRWRADRVDRQRARLVRIADEACRQSRRIWRVSILGPVDAASVLPDASVAEPGGRAVLAADAVVAIGPEGGWSPEELAAAGDRVDLGGNVLRTETAAMAAAALAMAARRVARAER
jgi:16S rRNA (uracil1498-N3)-methyltransferase